MKTKTKRDIQFVGGALILVIGLTYFLINSDSQSDLMLDSVDFDSNTFSQQNNDVISKITPLESGVEMGTNGVVTNIDKSGIANGEPAIISIMTDANSTHNISVPTGNLSLCEAEESIADVNTIVLGDKISIRGMTDGEGQIVPCESESHQLNVTGVYKNDEIGLSFDYKKSPGGYIMETEDDEFNHDSSIVTEVLLMNLNDGIDFFSSSVPRNVPPTIMLRVYNNPEELSAGEWAKVNSAETNYDRALETPVEITVGRKEAIGFTVDGSYLSDVYITTYNKYALLVTGEYTSYESEEFADIGQLVTTIVFDDR